MRKPLDLTGQVFGRLTVLSEDTQTAVGKRRRWRCVCFCGVTKSVAQQELRYGHSRSCGCLHKEQLRVRNTTHGSTETYTYKKWRSMHRRVTDTHKSRNKCYEGVDIDSRWGVYEHFLADMGECPPGYSLDRIDNTKGYTPSNCRWVPLFAQGANTSRNRTETVGGITKHVSALARDAGLQPDVVFDRVNKLGWDITRAVQTPKTKTKTKITPEMVQEMLRLHKEGASQYSIARQLGLSQGGVSLTLKKHKGKTQND